MANVGGLAAQLAKQAAQAARDEVAAAEGKSNPKAATTKAWTVPTLGQDFMLDDAMQRATRHVTGHYRSVLAPQGLQVDLEMVQPQDMDTAVADVRQGDGLMQASLREQQSGRLVKAYTAPALLTLFATQQQATGIVVDGQV